MIIFNTTYHVESGLEESFIAWLKETYIPSALRREALSRPQLCRVGPPDECEGSSFSLQFHVKDNDTLSLWYRETGVGLHEALVARFAGKVAGFSTLLEVIIEQV